MNSSERHAIAWSSEFDCAADALPGQLGCPVLKECCKRGLKSLHALLIGFLRTGAPLLMMAAFRLPGASPQAQAEMPVLTNALQIHQLTPDEARRGYPVRMQGVVTFYAQTIDELFIEDATGGMFVEVQSVGAAFPIAVGQLLEVEGSSSPGGFAPDIVPKQIRLLGTAALPAPRMVAFDQMVTGQEDCNWVEFSGIARSVGRDDFTRALGLEVVGSGGRVIVPIKDPDPVRCQSLIDAEVTVRGVCVTKFNRKGQLIRVAVQVSTMDDIIVSRPAPADPYAEPVHKIAQLLKYAPRQEHGHRVKVQGVVTLQVPRRFLAIADETQGLCIQTKQATPVQPGDRVEVLGYPEPGQYVSPVLQDAVFRKLDTGPAPAPLPIAAANGHRDTNHAALVEVEGVVLNHVRRLRDEILELELGSTIFDARLDALSGANGTLDAIPNGSRVRLTGICLVRPDLEPSADTPQAFSLLLRSGSEVVLLARPSWWTVRHTLWVLAATLLVFFASLGWVQILRRQVKAQTEVIRQKVQQEAALEERARISRDLHDDLGASLTHIAFLSEVARKEKACPAGVGEHLQEISTSSQEAFQALDEIVWVVTPKNDSLEQLTAYICHFAETFFRGTSTRCRLDPPASLPDLSIPTEIRNHLFYAVKEALNNIRKHARASEATVRLRFENPALVITIEDNGQGFCPDRARPAGNGLLNLRKRLEKLGGQFVLESAPGNGTRIRLTMVLEGQG